jgi:hypothetical protein
MAAIGVSALFFAALRVEAAPAVGIPIVGACVCYLAYRWLTAAMARREAVGSATGRLQKARLVAMSAVVAMAIIGLADVAFLVGYFGYMEFMRAPFIVARRVPYSEPRHVMMASVFGVTLALCVASMLRWMIWPATPDGGMSERSRPAPADVEADPAAQEESTNPVPHPDGAGIGMRDHSLSDSRR